jgi:hypothetical protein
MRRDRVHAFNMHYGVVVLLCERHAANGFLADDGGRRFTRLLTERWQAHGMLTKQRIRALAAHIRRVHNAANPKELPGSHAWRAERTECEERFAKGEPIATIIRDIRDPSRWYGRKPPSIRTIRRWCAEKRWLQPGPLKRASLILGHLASQALDVVLAVAAIQDWHSWIAFHGGIPPGQQRFEDRINKKPPMSL